MNAEQERPFVCSAPGCSQRFPTEDHLMIHRHKHEMTLKFPPIKSDNMLSDQTPTPTRFLKNCEEVGLFNELELEQDFCKSQRDDEDSKQNIALHGQAAQSQHQQSHGRMGGHDNGMVIQQALPSPQSSSVITQAPSTNRQIGPVPGSLSSLLHLRNRQRQPLPASMAGTLPDPSMPGSSAVLMPMERQMSMGSNMMGMQGPPHTSCSSPLGPSMHSEAKLRLKAALAHHPGTVSNGNMNTMGHMMDMMSSRQEQGGNGGGHPHMHLQQAPPHAYQHQSHAVHHHHHQSHTAHHQQSHAHHMHPHAHQSSPHHMHSGPPSQLSPAAQQMQPSQTLQTGPPSGGRRRRVVDEDPDERRRKFLERNRAAATRCRQKRKVWVMSLEKKAEELTQTNMQLQNEVTMLKNEVTQLKQLLLTHKDCPITAMQKESQGYLSPESSPAGSPSGGPQQQVIQHSSVSTSSTHTH
ncbi:hypothetical protein AALO_G00181390 [Alosa alosa]|uniref:Cyclic AMP-responsive element-binding protein 5 n=1 Tax=Alosa alosa TaxID=278164 RepID=A0AAV6G8W2_9TELE|nr:cyclic AMP-responsive element-binding protein 5 [Alosa alosa]XP_048117610.1 cyclic AMP-responsive element-binding protein 5 [Alosa alosa]KAG5271559.1 hypothetical protein AALO_G00181390 [Alosa alosa]